MPLVGSVETDQHADVGFLTLGDAPERVEVTPHEVARLDAQDDLARLAVAKVNGCCSEMQERTTLFVDTGVRPPQDVTPLL